MSKEPVLVFRHSEKEQCGYYGYEEELLVLDDGFDLLNFSIAVSNTDGSMDSYAHIDLPLAQCRKLGQALIDFANRREHWEET